MKFFEKMVFVFHNSDQDAENEPGAGIGPILSPGDAPELFTLLKDISRRMGGVYPSEVRISYLPGCGVLDLETDAPTRKRVLIIGFPCLLIWSVRELQAVLAHEMAHLKLGDVDFLRDVVQYSEELAGRKDGRTAEKGRWLGRLRGFATQNAGRMLNRLAAPVSHQMEFVADQWAADCYGGRHLARALEKLAVMQPIFREMLARFDPCDAPKDNVYSYFCRAWRALDKPLYEAFYDRLIHSRSMDDVRGVHPPIDERVRRLRREPRPPRKTASGAILLISDPKELAAVLHKRLFGAPEPPSVFYRTRA